MSDAVPEVPIPFDVPPCTDDPRIRDAFNAIRQMLLNGVVNNSQNFGGYSPSFYLDRSNHTGDLDLSVLSPQPSIRVKLTTGFTKPVDEWQADAKFFAWDGTMYDTIDPAFTIYDPFKVACWSQIGDKVFCTPDLQRGVLIATGTTCPNKFFVTISGPYTGGNTDASAISSSRMFDTVSAPFSFTGSFADGTTALIFWDDEAELWYIGEIYACAT